MIMFIGMVVTAAVFAFGVYYMFTRVGFRREYQYHYEKDANGNDIVRDESDDLNR